MDENEATVEELIQVQLAMIEAVIDVCEEPDPYHLDHRNSVSGLLSRLRGGLIAPEYAEVELSKLSDELDNYSREQNCKYREENPGFPY